MANISYHYDSHSAMNIRTMRGKTPKMLVAQDGAVGSIFFQNKEHPLIYA